MTAHEIYLEMRGWQQFLAAFLGMLALVIAALFNFHLNRKRDAAVRAEEIKSVAAALYGEIRLLRIHVASLAKSVSALYVRQGLHGEGTMKFDTQAHALPEATIYKALAAKLGLLPAPLVLDITRFYERISVTSEWLPRMRDDPDRGYSYDIRHVLEPARDAANDSLSALRTIEALIGVSDSDRAELLDLGETEGIISMQEALDHG